MNARLLMLGAVFSASMAAAQRATYAGGQLKIDAVNSTLAEVLSDVSTLTGVKIDLPGGLSAERLPSVVQGPGPAREVLAALLNDLRCDFVIQSSPTDPARLASVLILPRQKGPSPPAFQAPDPDPAQAAEAPAPIEASAEAPAPDPPPAAGDPVRQQLAAPPKTAPLSPPATVNQQNISQQLLRMYQQRMQMNGAVANPDSK